MLLSNLFLLALGFVQPPASGRFNQFQGKRQQPGFCVSLQSAHGSIWGRWKLARDLCQSENVNAGQPDYSYFILQAFFSVIYDFFFCFVLNLNVIFFFFRFTLRTHWGNESGSIALTVRILSTTSRLLLAPRCLQRVCCCRLIPAAQRGISVQVELKRLLIPWEFGCQKAHFYLWIYCGCSR